MTLLKRMPLLIIASLLLISVISTAGHSQNRITILVDAFGQPSNLKQDWGFAALIEYEGKRILFDTGNNSELFAHNVKALKIDLTRLDFVVISHRHGDHTDGMRHLLKVNPKVRMYVPNDEYFGGPTPQSFFRQSVPALPTHMRYFGGSIPVKIPHGSPWKAANLIKVDSLLDILPGIRLVRNISPTRVFGETPELSLSLQTPKGQILIVGCSHPGIETILKSVSAHDNRVHLIVGGLHLVNVAEPDVRKLANVLRQDWQVEGIAPGHCTGEVAFAAFQETYENKYQYAGVGTVINIP